MSFVGKAIELVRKYEAKMKTTLDFHIKGSIPSKKIDNAIKSFACGLDKTTIIAFYDTSITNSGKSGYIFTDTKVYYREIMGKPKKLWYYDIEKIELSNTHKKDCNREIRFYLYDGSVVIWTSSFFNKTPLFNFFNELLKIVRRPKSATSTNIEYEKIKSSGSTAGGIAYSNYKTVNQLYNEEIFHARQGHGFAAERTNTLYDNWHGHKAKVVGDDNAKNGADRVVDGIYIQSKYCATGSECINDCFENDGKGAFRYLKNGKPMPIEVPSDKYEAAVKQMEEKIRNGQIDKVIDPSEAKNIVRKGNITYEQARNIAKAGTVESLSYDAAKGAITASSAFGITAIITFATSIWNGENFDKSLKLATYSGLKVGGTAFITSVIASQLCKAGLNSAMVASSEAIVSVMGYKAAAILVNAFRSGAKIYGAAAMKSAAKLLRGNLITAGVTAVVMSSFDIANIFRHRISTKQLFKNLSNTTATIAGGTGGWLAGAAIGSAILPVAGTVIGGIIGSMGVGMVAGKVTDKVLDRYIEDDAKEMIRIIEYVFSQMASEYLLNKKEVEKSIDKLGEKLSGELLKDMFSSNNRELFARNLSTPIIEKEISKRSIIKLPTEEQMIAELRIILEDIYDTSVNE